MHCPRCGATATVGQTFCRACGLSLEKVAALLGEELGLHPTQTDTDVTRLRERQLKLERWASLVGLSTFALLLLLMIVVVFSQMILKGGAIALGGLLIILFTLGAGMMGGFQTYSKYLKNKLAQRPLPPSPMPEPVDKTTALEPNRPAVGSITEPTTELLPSRSANTGRISG